MKIGLFQYNPEWENKYINQQKILDLANQSKLSFDLVVFPEMSLTGFTMKTSLGEPFDLGQSETLQFFSDLAKNLSSNIIAGFIERENEKFFNTLFFVNRSGKVISKYRKIHLFSFANEDKFYTPGNEPVIVENENLIIGLSVCYDLRFPELFRYYAKAKVDLIVNIANWPDSRIDHYVHLLKSRAIENQCFVIGVNRVGYGGKNYYDGRSSIFGPLGNEIISVINEEKLIEAEINLENIKDVRKQFPFLTDIKLI